ncbi:hypothetical protein BO70DRAFT_377926 [Aspergillus heteromorphus CBS 117.55]|uniref:Genetic interactor of prohibitins 3, mitochondrial n=1 Tax=Aspergillus heteromorphus CBS 117.55 TaxID=1448321 RepID=A0A317WQU9_9EURO|nr:uncharacterized protein BO70DRAFT_377926 [Aspergillus heteromorphus CBS 117.55]PWY88435.1 hypothetical protein BO70DRAFT_377926 [Aspergillus heteromorphus CBS 117.55]
MSPYLGRVIPRGPTLNRLSSRLPRQSLQLSRPCTRAAVFSQPEVLPVRSLDGLNHRILLRSFSTNRPLRVSAPEQISILADPESPEPPEYSADTDSPEQPDLVADALPLDALPLPLCCPGCGAFAQTVEPLEPGFYDTTKKQTRKRMAETQQLAERLNEESEEGVGLDLKNDAETAATEIRQHLELIEEKGKPRREPAAVGRAIATASNYLKSATAPVQICDRCHDLLHHNKAMPVIAPSMSAIRAYLDESPYTHNRIYHVVDAADFPMSLVRYIYQELGIFNQRTKNRRSASYRYKQGVKMPTISFIITRADLLAPTKEQADSKMKFFQSVLRDTLKHQAADYRLGNVYLISAHRGWWTKNVKKEIREHGGGIWVVGKTNVGKSSFIESCFPKDTRNLEKIADMVQRHKESKLTPNPNISVLHGTENVLLPPPPPEGLHPFLPIVSSLPGTTVSPIRIPFGHGKGEMFDLPGLKRHDLSDYVFDEHKRDLIMSSRVNPEHMSIKPGQSLLLGGGLVRITPTHPDTVLMAACFVSPALQPFVTRTDKAMEIQAERRHYPGTIIAKGFGDGIRPAGTFDLKWDVTKSHLPRSIAKALQDKIIKKAPSLPYKVMSTDILIEGCGWIELTVQLRSKPTQPTPETKPTSTTTTTRSTTSKPEFDDMEPVIDFNPKQDMDPLEPESEDGTTSDPRFGLTPKPNPDSPPSSFPQVEIFTPRGLHVGSRAPIECYPIIAKRQAAEQRKKAGRGRPAISQRHRAQGGGAGPRSGSRSSAAE